MLKGVGIMDHPEICGGLKSVGEGESPHRESGVSHLEQVHYSHVHDEDGGVGSKDLCVRFAERGKGAVCSMLVVMVAMVVVMAVVVAVPLVGMALM